MHQVTVFLFFIVALASVSRVRADIIAYYGPFNDNTTTAPFSVELGGIASVTVGNWVPRGVRNGLIVACPRADAYPAEGEDHSREIVMCAMKSPIGKADTTAPLQHLEDILTVVERWGFAAGISVISNRAGITAIWTSGNIAQAPRVFVMDMHVGYTEYVYPGLNVSLVFSDDNPYFVLSESPLAWIANTVYAAICFGFTGWACYAMYCWGWFFHWKMHPILVSIAFIVVANVIRALNAINFVDTRLLWTHELTRSFYTLHLVATLSGSFLVLASIHDILRRSRGIRGGSMDKFLPTMRIPFFLGIAVLCTMEVVTQVLQVVLVPSPPAMSFVTIGFYVIADIVTCGYYIYCYRHLIREMDKMASGAVRDRVALFKRLMIWKPVGHIGWLITLIISLVIGFTMKDTLAYLYTQTAVALVGFSFVLMIDATTLLAIGLPIARDGDTTSSTAPKGMSGKPTRKSNSSSNKTPSTKSGSLADTVKTVHGPGTALGSTSHSTELFDSKIASASSSSSSS